MTADKLVALAACPFCGGDARRVAGSDNENWAGVECNPCGVCMDDQGSGCWDRVVTAWNTRALAQSAASGSPPYVELLKSPDGKLYWQTSIPPLTMPLGRYQLMEL